MEYTFSAGGIILNQHQDVLLINERGNFWGFPKGTIEQGEDARSAAIREIKEETGLTQLTYVAEFGVYQRHPLDDHGQPRPHILKTITLFIFTTAQDVPAQNDENNTTKWIALHEVAKVLTNPIDAGFFREHTLRLKSLL